jgi:hypothetical protein
MTEAGGTPYAVLLGDEAIRREFEQSFAGKLDFSVYGPHGAWRNLLTTKRFVEFAVEKGLLEPLPSPEQRWYENTVRINEPGLPTWAGLDRDQKDKVRVECRDHTESIDILARIVNDGPG